MSNINSLRLVHEEEAVQPRQAQYRVLLSATLVTTTYERPVKLRNLSATGAQIEGMSLPAQGTDVILKRGDLEIFASVAWSQGKRCALQFETALSEVELLGQLNHRRGATPAVDPVDQRRSGFREPDLIEADRRTVAEWANPARRLA